VARDVKEFDMSRLGKVSALALAGCCGLVATPSSADPWRTPFQGASFNRPASDFHVAPNSAALVHTLWCGTGCGRRDGAENLNLTFSDFSYGVYSTVGGDGFGAAADTTCTVQGRKGEINELAGQTIPCNVKWRPSGGNWDGNFDDDSQMIVLDPPTGRMWEFWHAVVDADRTIVADHARLDHDPHGDVLEYHSSSDAHSVGSRSANLAYLAMLPLPRELAIYGRFTHALPLLLPVEDKGGSFVPPAFASDGDVYGVVDGIPTGTRFALRVTDADIDAWIEALPSCVSDAGRATYRQIAIAMRDYGMVVVDNAGSAHVQFADVTNPAVYNQWHSRGVWPPVACKYKKFPRDALDGLIREDRLVALSPP
jgi:hypothetical protein